MDQTSETTAQGAIIMKRPRITIEQKLIGSRPADRAGNTDFVSKTMEAVERASGRQSFAAALNQPKESLIMKIRIKLQHLPKIAIIALVAVGVGLLSGTAYAAYRWLEPKVTITEINPSNQDGRREYSLDQQCGDSIFVNKPPKYEVVSGSHISDEEALKVFQNSCAYNALTDFIEKTWVSDNDNESAEKKKPGDPVTIYTSNNLFAGSNSENFGLTFGKVTAFDGTSITISQTMYVIDRTNTSTATKLGGYEYYPEGVTVTRTLSVLPEAQVWDKGAPSATNVLKIGDTVRLVHKTVNILDKNKNLGPQTVNGAAGIVRTDVDGAYLADEATGNPAIVKALAGLYDCHNNRPYICAGPLGQAMAQVYNSFPDGASKDEYLRTDLDDKERQERMIQGRITGIDGKRLTIKTAGKQDTVHVELPYDALAAYNKKRTGTVPASINTLMDDVSGPRVGLGDMLVVGYIQHPNDNRLQIKPSDIIYLTGLQYIKADGTLANY
jgi:hypothetical protein